MSWKKWKKKLKKAAKAVTKVAPKITVGKDLGAKNLGKAGTSLYKSAGNVGSQLVKTVGKGTEGIVANTADIGGAALKGDFKGIGKEGLELLQSGKDVLKGTANAGITASLAGVKAAGEGTGSKDIVKGATNVEREAQKGVNKYGDIAADIGLSAIPGFGQAYALTKAGLGATSKDGLKGLTSVEGLTDMALGAAASKLGVNPNAITGAKMGLSAAQGDLKGAALQGLGSFAGLDPDQMKMANTGVSALTGDKKGLASGLASQFGAGESTASMLGAVAGGKKGDIISQLGGQLGLDPKITSTLGAVASGDLKGEALKQLGSLSGFDTKQLQTGLSALTGDKAGLASGLASQFGAGDVASGMIGKFAGGQGAREVISDEAGAFAKDEANRMLDEQMGRAGMDRTQLKELEKTVGQVTRAPAALKAAAESTYKIAAGDTLSAIAKKMGTTVDELKAANPQIKDINKIVAGANLNLPGAVKQAAGMVEGARASITDKFLKDASGKTIMGPNNAPIPNPSYNQEEADKLAIQQQGGTGKQIPLPEEKGFLDKAGEFLGGVKDKVTGAVGAAGGFIKENPMLATGALQAGAATAGFMAGQKARDEQEELLKKQILETQGVDALEKYELSKQRDAAYQEQQKFLEERIAGGGMTAKEREMQEEGRMKAAKMAAAGRLAGVEQQARMGQGVTGAGSALAASLAGAQAQAQAGAESERAVATSAAENVERAFAARPAALEAKAKTEMDLAQMKDIQELSKVKQLGETRTQQGAMAISEGAAKGLLASSLADLGTRAVLGQQIGPSDATADERKIAAEADADRKKADLQAKAAAAASVSGTTTAQPNIQPQQSTPPLPQKEADKFNQAGKAPITAATKPAPTTAAPKPAVPKPAPKPGEGQGYGVLISPTQQAAIDATKKKADDLKASAQKQVEDAKKKAEELKKSTTKAVNSIVPESFKNIFNAK